MLSTLQRQYPILGFGVKEFLICEWKRASIRRNSGNSKNSYAKFVRAQVFGRGDLAEILNKPQSFVSKYESGERRLDLLELGEICQAVGIGLTDFVRRFEEAIR